LYTGVAPEPDHPEHKPIIGISNLIGLQGLAILDKDMSMVSKNYFKIIYNDVIHVPRSWRDSAILDISNNTASMLNKTNHRSHRDR